MNADFSYIYNLIVIFVLIGLNGFFVAAEFALVSVRRSRVEELVALGSSRALHLQNVLKDLDRYIAGTQVGITLASLALGWLGEPLLARGLESMITSIPGVEVPPVVLHSLSFALAFLAITVLHVVLGELVPKSLAIQNPEKVSLAIGRTMSVIVVILHPLIWSLNGIGNRVLKMLGIGPAGELHNVHSVEELQILVQQSHEAGMLDETERQVLERSFRFAELTAKDIMVRRIDLVALDLDEPRDALLEKAATSIHSRLPCYVDSLDTIVGILYIHDIFRAYHHNTLPKDLRVLCRPVLAVPEGIHLDDLLDFFQENHTQIAIVVDEHGGTAGVVTFEDLVEEVTGEIRDEFESEEEYPQHLPDGRIILRGDMRIDEVNSTLGWTLPDESVDTLAGFIMYRLGRIARVDDEVVTEFGHLKVIDMARMRITRIAVLPNAGVEATG